MPAQPLQPARQTNERDPQGRVFELPHVRRLGRDDDRRRGDLAEAITRLKQERSDGYLSPTAGHGSPDRWSKPA
jgi:hypothetical protein